MTLEYTTTPSGQPVNWSLVPEHLRGGLDRWIMHGIMPGSFLQAVLNNDLFEAMGRADMVSRNGLYGICSFISTYAPLGARGPLDEWHKRRGLKGVMGDD